MAAWEVYVHDQALAEMRQLKCDDPKLFRRVLRMFDEMSQMRDPRRYPNVKPLKGCAEGWYRLAIYDVQWRIVFRLLRDNGAGMVEIHKTEPVPQHGDDDKAIEITRSHHRGGAYGLALLNRVMACEKDDQVNA